MRARRCRVPEGPGSAADGELGGSRPKTIGPIGTRQAGLSEQQIQKAVFAHLRARGTPGAFAFHPANGGYRRPIEAKILQGLGVRAGVPDVIAVHRGRTFALELKAEGGRLTEAQERVLIELREAGATATHAHGLDQALHLLETWGLLRGRS
jgi:hypothetical protein